MKLQKQLSRKVKSKEYPKWVVTIPPKKIQEAGWKEGMTLEISVKDRKIVLEPKNQP
jgi:bifunctional DNA-binding transcriptional regulator/antitoxin component of YhaV-PrlF toxin-antitoxin module